MRDYRVYFKELPDNYYCVSADTRSEAVRVAKRTARGYPTTQPRKQLTVARVEVNGEEAWV